MRAIVIWFGFTCAVVVTGSRNGVFINGKPMAASGDLASGCPNK